MYGWIMKQMIPFLGLIITVTSPFVPPFQMDQQTR